MDLTIQAVIDESFMSNLIIHGMFVELLHLLFDLHYSIDRTYTIKLNFYDIIVESYNIGLNFYDLIVEFYSSDLTFPS